MHLSLADAARLLGKNSRQVRYLIQTGRIKAQKVESRWVVERESLPISAQQASARKRRLDRAADLTEDVLRHQAIDKSHYSLVDLKACGLGRELYQTCLNLLGKDHHATVCLNAID